MTAHLRSEEFVDALEGSLVRDRRQHLDACDRCQTELAELRELAGRARSGSDVPEPSPLFWDHFSARVRASVGAETARKRAFWILGWRPMAAMAVLVAVLLAVRVGRDIDRGRDVGTVTAPSGAAGAEDELPDFVASGLSFEDSIVAQLTPEQRVELARLLQTENGSLE